MQGTLPIVTDQFATVTVVTREEIQRAPALDPGRPAVRQARHHRLEFCARRFKPADRPRPRRQSCRYHGQRQSAAVACRTSAKTTSSRSIPLASNQIEVIRGPATLRYGSQAIGGIVSRSTIGFPRRCHADRRALRPESSSAACSRLRLLPHSKCAAPSQASTMALKAAHCSMPASGISPSTPMPLGAAAATTGCRAIPIWSRPSGGTAVRDPARRVQRDAAELMDAVERGVGRRLVHFPRRLCRRRVCAEQQPLRHSRGRRRRTSHPHRHAPGQGDRQGRVPAGHHRSRRDSLLVGLYRLQAQRGRTRRSDRSSFDGIQQTFTNKRSRGASRCNSRRSICGSPSSQQRSACRAATRI